MNKRVKYYFINRRIDTKEIEDLKVYNLDISQSELMEKISKYNDPASGPMEHIQVHQSLMKEVIDLALTWKAKKDLDDISDQLARIENEIYGITCDIRECTKNCKPTI